MEQQKLIWKISEHGGENNMPSRRIEKKHKKQSLRRELEARLQVLNTTDLEIQQLDAEIAKTKKLLKKKKTTLEKLQRELVNINALVENSNIQKIFRKDITLADLSVLRDQVRGTGVGTEGDRRSGEEVYGLIKRYNELVKMGVIRRDNMFSKYDEAEYMERILSRTEMQRIVDEAEAHHTRRLAESEAETARKLAGMPRF